MTEICFTLYNIDLEQIEKKFFSEKNIKKEKVVDKNPFITFLDDNKLNKRCILSMVDLKTQQPITKRYCFWDRNHIPDDVLPIGCPVKYIHSQLVKQYISEISKDSYLIKENVSKNDIPNIKKGLNNINSPIKITKSDLSLLKRGTFLVDGCFCSFNCAVAYIEENKNNIIYKDSYYLLVKMYEEFYETEIDIIKQAPHWRLLEEYGGNLNIKNFRHTFSKITFTDMGLWQKIDTMPLGFIYEEKIKF